MFPSLSWPDAVVQLYPSTSAQQRPPLSWPEAVVNIHPLDVDIVVINASATSWPEATVDSIHLIWTSLSSMFPFLSWPEAVVQLNPSTSAPQRPSISWPEAVVNLHPLDLDIVVINISVPFLARSRGATLSIHISPAEAVPFLAKGSGATPSIVVSKARGN